MHIRQKDCIMLPDMNQISIEQEHNELKQQLQRANEEMAQQVKYSPLWMAARAKYNTAANRLHRMGISMSKIHRLIGIYGHDYTNKGDGIHDIQN